MLKKWTLSSLFLAVVTLNVQAQSSAPLQDTLVGKKMNLSFVNVYGKGSFGPFNVNVDRDMFLENGEVKIVDRGEPMDEDGDDKMDLCDFTNTIEFENATHFTVTNKNESCKFNKNPASGSWKVTHVGGAQALKLNFDQDQGNNNKLSAPLKINEHNENEIKFSETQVLGSLRIKVTMKFFFNE